MNFTFFLICRKCGRTASKKFDTTEADIRKKIKLANKALFLPQYLICPGCMGIKTIEVEVHREKSK